MHFAIVLCLFEREYDPFFALPRMTSIRSLEVQTHLNWHAVVRGDGLAGPALPRARQMLRQSAIPADNIDWANLPAGERERPFVTKVTGTSCGLSLVLGASMQRWTPSRPPAVERRTLLDWMMMIAGQQITCSTWRRLSSRCLGLGSPTHNPPCGCRV